MPTDARQADAVTGGRGSRAIVRSAYGPWLLLALALVAAPASVPAAAVHAATVSAVDGRAGVLLVAVDAEPVESRVEACVAGDHGLPGVGRVAFATPLEALGVGRVALPPPGVA
ncbi:MAG: hypothetical protein AAF297_09895 [Planctomycetota bacterium]